MRAARACEKRLISGGNLTKNMVDSDQTLKEKAADQQGGRIG
jgi:hypothetical protein